MRFLTCLFVLLLSLTYELHADQIPYNFCYITDVDTSLIESPRYRGMDNFTGRPVPGCEAPRMIATLEAATALKEANTELKKHGFMLVVYEAYRPQRVTDEFLRWSKVPHDCVAQTKYYPKVDKGDLFKLGYIADRSPHSRGSSFAVTLIRADMPPKVVDLKEHCLTNGEPIPFLDDGTVDMGSSFDLLHPVSKYDSPLVGDAQKKMRYYLRHVMEAYGFCGHPEAWWLFTLKKEPHPNRYFDFVDLEKKTVSTDLDEIKRIIRPPVVPYYTPTFKKLEGN